MIVYKFQWPGVGHRKLKLGFGRILILSKIMYCYDCYARPNILKICRLVIRMGIFMALHLKLIYFHNRNK